MNKSNYLAPVSEALQLRTEGMICTSGEPDALTGTLPGYENGDLLDWDLL